MKKLFSNYIFSIAVYAGVLFTSCQKDDFLISNAPTNFSEVFETFWNKMNINYVYWDIDTTDWDAVYKRYKPIFAQLDLKKHADNLKSVQYFDDMTKGLIDGHYHISFSNAAIAGSSVYPSFERKQNLAKFHYPYSYYALDTSYLDPNFKKVSDYNNTYNGYPLTILCGSIDNKIIFFSCTNFSLFKSFYSNSANGVKVTLQFFFNKLANLPENIKGIIIDVRGNQGGDLADLNFLVGHFIDKPLHFGYTRSKSGNGRLDYTPWIKAIITPEPNAKAIRIPIIVLADLNSASLSEAVVMAIKAIPNGIFIGETTWGATGPITDEEVYNDGQFGIPNFLTVLTSSCTFKYIDGKIYEGIGFSPDITLPFNSYEINIGKDAQLEKAISLFH